MLRQRRISCETFIHSWFFLDRFCDREVPVFASCSKYSRRDVLEHNNTYNSILMIKFQTTTPTDPAWSKGPRIRQSSLLVRFFPNMYVASKRALQKHIVAMVWKRSPSLNVGTTNTAITRRRQKAKDAIARYCEMFPSMSSWSSENMILFLLCLSDSFLQPQKSQKRKLNETETNLSLYTVQVVLWGSDAECCKDFRY